MDVSRVVETVVKVVSTLGGCVDVSVSFVVSNAVVGGFTVVVVTVVGVRVVDDSEVVLVFFIVTVIGGVVPVMFARVCVMGPMDVVSSVLKFFVVVDLLVIVGVVSVIKGKVAVTGSRDVLTVVSSVVVL